MKVLASLLLCGASTYQRQVNNNKKRENEAVAAAVVDIGAMRSLTYPTVTLSVAAEIKSANTEWSVHAFSHSIASFWRQSQDFRPDEFRLLKFG